MLKNNFRMVSLTLYKVVFKQLLTKVISLQLRFIALALLASVTIAEENIEGPPFRLIKKYENEVSCIFKLFFVIPFVSEPKVVERQYKGGLKWACTRRYSGDSSSTQFWRLFGYILNQNDQCEYAKGPQKSSPGFK